MTERIEKAISLCGKLEYSMMEEYCKNWYAAHDIFRLTAEQELNDGKSANEILEAFGKIIQEFVTAHIISTERRAIDRNINCRKAEISFTVDADGISFRLKCAGTEYDVTENSNIPDMLREIMLDKTGV